MLEKAQTQNIFDINDTSPLELVQIDKSDGGQIIRVIPKEYHLYGVLKLFRSIMFNPEQQKTLSLETIYQVYDLTLQKLKRSREGKLVLNKTESSYWIKDFLLINNYLCHLIVKESPVREALLELVIRTGFAIEKNVQIKYGKNGFKNFIGPIVSDALVTLATLYFKADQFHLSEAYCLKHLVYLETLSESGLNDLSKRKFLAKILLARIYLKSGNSQVAVDFFKTSDKNLKHYYNAEFNYVLPNLWGLYKDTLCHFYDKNKDLLKALDLYQSFLNDYTLVNTSRQTHSLKPETSKIMEKDIKFIHLIFEQAKPKYKNEFDDKVKKSLLLKDKVRQFEFDFDKNSLTLTFENSALNLFLKQAFKDKCAGCISHSDNQFLVPINQCSIKQLERVCQYALFLQEEHLTRQAQREQVKTPEIVFRPPVNSQPESVSETSIFSASVISQPEKISSTLTVQTNVARKNKKKQQQQKQSAKNMIPHPPLSKPEVPRIRYQWPSGLAYDSSENNQGQVKILTNDFLPDGIWFGYIPDWINWLKIDKHYIEEFKGRLIRGSISQGCIREITKQLRTWKNQNFSTEHRYKLKIVVKNHDYRIYGWIEEVLIDEEGKAHFLVCFGFLGNHKLQYLPDPEKVKKDSLNAEKTIPKEEQANQSNMAEQFIEKLTAVIYNDSLVIPVEMRNILQGLINSLYNSAQIFGERGLTLEQATILFPSLEKMCDQIVELGQMELGSKEQLSILKNMTDLLSVLNVQTIYQPIISPLLKVVKHVESYYFVDELQPGQPLQEVIFKESSEDILAAAQLIKRMSERSKEIAEDMSEFKKTVTGQQQVNKTQIAPIIQKQSPLRKDVTEIIKHEAGEQKLKF